MPALLLLLASIAIVAAVAIDENPASLLLSIVAGTLVVIACVVYDRRLENARYSAYVKWSVERPDQRREDRR